MKKWIDPMPAGVKMTGKDGLVYYCSACKTNEVIGRRPYPDGREFLGLYEELGKRAWEHNIKVHIEPGAARSRRKRAAAKKPVFATRLQPIPARTTQSSIFDLLGAS